MVYITVNALTMTVEQIRNTLRGAEMAAYGDDCIFVYPHPVSAAFPGQKVLLTLEPITTYKSPSTAGEIG